ncbi:translation initiation factor IF-2, partial [Limnothrix sp. PR1529]
ASATPEPIAEKKAELKTPPRPGTAPRPVKKPELVGPPSRPAKPAESKPAEPRAGAPSRPSRPTRPGEAKGPAAGGPGKGAPPTIVELRRPKPVRPTEATADGSADGTAAAPAAKLLEKPTRPASSGEDYENKLNRPTLNRPTKKGKDWEAEEEERARIAKDKAGKNKRRNQVEFEDEDDFEEDDELMMEGVDGQPAPFQVSLSIARPPKPKGVTPPKPAPQPKPVTKKGASRPPQRERREQQVKKERPELITLTEGLTVAELAEKLAVPETEVVKRLFLKGMAVSITQTLDVPTATMVAEELGVMVETAEKESEARKVTEMLDVADLESLQRRPPVVTIMGHVDHGKTTLLDSIRKTKVAQGEAGGITQHIGAYHVQVDQEGGSKKVVFLDTPGHEAFTAMRARGARVTDIAILVVAADDGVQPQTIEALSHARAAEVPIVVAINKIDKEGANPDRVKQELAERGLVPEEWGGDTIMVPVSALKGLYLDDLLENLLLVAEVEDLMANPDRLARGTVIEAHLDRARGPVATLLVQNGTLRVGDILLAGPALGKVRAMIDDRGHRVDAATPSFAVEVLGLSEVPAAGEEFEVFANEKDARAIASQRSDQQRQSRLQQAMASRRVSLTSISGQAQEGELKELNLVLKADVQGSLEAILGSLQQLPQNEVQVRVLLAAPGEISETDIDLAAASSAVVVGFNTTLAPGARRSADEAGIDVREYSVIYKLLDDIQAAMEGMLDPEEVEEPLGQAEVRGVFPVGRGTVAGCYVQSGKLIRDCLLRVRRGKELVFQGRMDSLKRFKEDTKEVNSGYECGVNSSGFNDWQMGDIIEAYRLVAKRRTLSL